MESEIRAALHQLKSDARCLAGITDTRIRQVLNDLAETAVANQDRILEDNRKDLERMDPENPKYDRLLLSEERIAGIASDIRNVAGLPSPLKQCLEEKELPNGLHLQKISVPLGTIGIVFESRPNVTFDVFSLCFKSGNAVVLKGSRDAHYSNLQIVRLIHKVLNDHNIPPIAYLAPSERASLQHILEADNYIDTIIPRGGQGLIDYVRKHSKVPVIETGAGIVHTYVDRSADLTKAKAIIKNAKTRRVSVCNALDTLIIHRDLLPELPELVKGLDQQFELKIHADQTAFNVLSGKYRADLLAKAAEDSFGTEFLSMQMAVKTVSDPGEALDHIFQYSSKHSEAVIAEDEAIVDRFLNEIDAAVVYANTSTAFTDGAQFGLGAEIGISTQKLHARGPMALRELTSYKWLVRGSGQTRG